MEYSEVLCKRVINKEKGSALKLLYQIKLCLSNDPNIINKDLLSTSKTLISRNKSNYTTKNLTNKELNMNKHLIK